MDRHHLDTLIPEIVRRLREALSPVVVYVFGSCASKALGPHGDIDLLVIVDQSEQSFFERGARAYRALRGIGVPVDVQVYTRDEFEPRARIELFKELAEHFRGRAAFPDEATLGMTDEQYVRNVVDSIYNAGRAERQKQSA